MSVLETFLPLSVYRYINILSPPYCFHVIYRSILTAEMPRNVHNISKRKCWMYTSMSVRSDLIKGQNEYEGESYFATKRKYSNDIIFHNRGPNVGELRF